MDPFDARLQYIQLLETLNPSVASVSKTIQFALKNSELHEDFHSCVLEVLDKLHLNSKMNVLYYLQELASVIVGTSHSPDGKPYLKNLMNDFKLILTKVVPDDNLVNLRSSVDILSSLEQMYGETNSELKDFYFNLTLADSSDPKFPKPTKETGFTDAWIYLIEKKLKGFTNRKELLSQPESEEGEQDPPVTFTKEQILSRIETDRERHKRIKEVSWTVTRNSSTGNTLNILKNCIDASEFDALWDQHDEMTEADFQELKELNEIAKSSYNL